MKSLMKSNSDEWGIKNLQNCILNIADYIDQLCSQYKINYCLMGGSALGAVRHKGFIPWDDDLDIFMTPDNYEKFREVFYKYGDKTNFYLQQFGNKGDQYGLVSMAKLRMNGTRLIEESLAERDIHHGIYVDIFILHVCPDNLIFRYWQYFWCKYLVAKDLAHKNYMRHGKIMNIALKSLTLFPRLFLVRFALKQIYRYRNLDSKYLCHFLGRAWMKNGLYKRSYFRGTKKSSFETLALSIPIECENYLHDRWGDYMKIPSLEEIKYFQHSKNWSTDSPFLGFNKEAKYKDEKYLIV